MFSTWSIPMPLSVLHSFHSVHQQECDLVAAKDLRHVNCSRFLLCVNVWMKILNSMRWREEMMRRNMNYKLSSLFLQRASNRTAPNSVVVLFVALKSSFTWGLISFLRILRPSIDTRHQTLTTMCVALQDGDCTSITVVISFSIEIHFMYVSCW